MQIGPRKIKAMGGFLRSSDAKIGDSAEFDEHLAKSPAAPPEKLVLDALLCGQALTGSEIDSQIEALDRPAVEAVLRELLAQRAVVQAEEAPADASLGEDRPVREGGNVDGTRYLITDIGRRAASYFGITS